MRQVIADRDDVVFFTSMTGNKLTNEEEYSFMDVLNLILYWRKTIRFTADYVRDHDKPV